MSKIRFPLGDIEDDPKEEETPIVDDNTDDEGGGNAVDREKLGYTDDQSSFDRLDEK